MKRSHCKHTELSKKSNQLKNLNFFISIIWILHFVKALSRENKLMNVIEDLHLNIHDFKFRISQSCNKHFWNSTFSGKIIRFWASCCDIKVSENGKFKFEIIILCFVLVSFFFLGYFKAIFYFTLRQKMQFSRKIGLTAKWVFNRRMQWNGKYFYSLLSFLYWFVGNPEKKTNQKVMQMCNPMRNGHRLSIAIWERFLIFYVTANHWQIAMRFFLQSQSFL